MSLIADGLLIATCLTTALYCLVLSRRLRRLSDTDEGLGQQILKLNAALAETKAAVNEIRATARAASEQLEQDIETARRQSNQLQRQIARALKSGVGSPAAPGAPLATPIDDRPRDRTEQDDPDEISSLDDATFVDFEAAGEVEEDLDAALRAADLASEAVADEEAADEEVARDMEDLTAEEPFAGTGDVSEAENHWPFDEPEANAEDDDDWELPAEIGAETAKPAEPPARPARRGGDAGPGDAGRLRVERMSV